MGSYLKIKIAALFLLVATAVLASGRDLYLAAAGPTPLRFQWELPQLDPARLLPPLQMSDAAAATNAAAASVPQHATETEKPAMSEALEAPTDTRGNFDRPPEPFTPAPQDEAAQNPVNQISPQMLLRYFSRNGTNEVLVPYTVDFTPPVPTRTGDSSATYISD